jgi:hypothetical protein
MLTTLIALTAIFSAILATQNYILSEIHEETSEELNPHRNVAS